MEQIGWRLVDYGTAQKAPVLTSAAWSTSRNSCFDNPTWGDSLLLGLLSPRAVLREPSGWGTKGGWAGQGV